MLSFPSNQSTWSDRGTFFGYARRPWAPRRLFVRATKTKSTLFATMNELVAQFPAMDFAMAYGSVAFKQDQYDNSKSMLDLVFAVSDAEAWHAANLETFPHHYSAMMRHCGPRIISSIQQNYGAGLYYNTLVRTMYIIRMSVQIAFIDSDGVPWRTMHQIRGHFDPTAL